MILTVIVCALASYRLARIVTQDTITLPFRERLYLFAYDEDNAVASRTADGQQVMVAAPRAAWRAWFYDLLTCPLCLGVWIAAGVYSAWRWWDVEAVHAVILVFAVAGLQCFLSLRED